MKRISVITINFNNRPGLEKTFDSVLPQLDEAVEFIVIDGGSTDGSRELIEREAGRIAYRVSEKDHGIYHAQNKGIARAVGDYCLFLNSGDTLAAPDTLRRMLPSLGGQDIVYGDLIIIDANGVKTRLSSPPTPNVSHFMLSTLWHPCAFIKRDLFTRLGTYREDLKITADYEFFIRAILRHNASTRHIALPVAVFDLSGISNDPRQKQLQEEERRKSWELNFSQAAISAFEDYTKVLRSSEYKWGGILRKIVRPFGRKK